MSGALPGSTGLPAAGDTYVWAWTVRLVLANSKAVATKCGFQVSVDLFRRGLHPLPFSDGEGSQPQASLNAPLSIGEGMGVRPRRPRHVHRPEICSKCGSEKRFIGGEEW